MTVKAQSSTIFKNGVMLMIFQIAKIVFPFVTLPYLTRIFTTDTYGTVTYTKTIMNYMQIFVDFGFVLSATKDIVNCKGDNKKIGTISGDTLMARIILGLFGFVVTGILCLCLPILRANILFVMLSYSVVFLSVFLMDFLFRGLEIMHVITIRFILMKTISTVLTFFLIKDDSQILLIPILDIISSLAAIGLVFIEIKKRNIKLRITKLSSIVAKIKDSFIYFISSAASTSLNALSTIIIGIYGSATDVAHWGLAMQIIGTITALYNPFCDSIYPEMVRSKKLSLVTKTVKMFLPVVIVGCIASYFASGLIFKILGGEKYLEAIPIFRLLIPVLFFGFLSMLYGWPTLGAINKHKTATATTIISALFNLVLLLVLPIFGLFTLANVAILRVVSELLMFALRFGSMLKNRRLFSD